MTNIRNRTSEVYVSIDVEAAGPIPGEYSMLSMGACLVDDLEETFYAELTPINSNFMADALQVGGLSIADLERSGEAPDEAMHRFSRWLQKFTGALVFVGFNAAFDWQFVNWYYMKFTGANPFGFSALDMKAFYMGMAGVLWHETSSSHLPERFRPTRPLTHNALDDAVAQAEMFSKMLSASRNGH